MPSTRDIKRRQKSVKNTGQVTRAMQMVAASKMRKAQLVALQSRPYAEKALSILAGIKQRQPDIRNIYLDELTGSDPVSSQLLAIVITSDKGLCGGLNSAVIRESEKIFEQYKKNEYNIELVLVGAKSKSYFERMKLPILETFKSVGDYIELEQVKPISRFIQEKYVRGGSHINKVLAIYTEFQSTLKQKVSRRQILPISEDLFKDLILDITPVSGQWSVVSGPAYASPSPKTTELHSEDSAGKQEYIFEPSPQVVLDNLIPFLIDIYIYHIILESNASEHSARMVAMKNASDNAKKILGELTLSYNKARQAAITREISEITAGVEALK